MTTLRLTTPLMSRTNGQGLWTADRVQTIIRSLIVHPVHIWEPLDASLDLDVLFTIPRGHQLRGLIYTDTGWLRTFRSSLSQRGVSLRLARLIDYTEQGMQESRLVSLNAVGTERDIQTLHAQLLQIS